MNAAAFDNSELNVAAPVVSGLGRLCNHLKN